MEWDEDRNNGDKFLSPCSCLIWVRNRIQLSPVYFTGGTRECIWPELLPSTDIESHFTRLHASEAVRDVKRSHIYTPSQIARISRCNGSARACDYSYCICRRRRTSIKSDALEVRQLNMQNQCMLARITQRMMEPSQVDNHNTWERRSSVLLSFSDSQPQYSKTPAQELPERGLWETSTAIYLM